MSAEKKSLMETRFYPILFMILVTIFFIGILAFFYNATIDKVKSYEQTNYKKSLLTLFDLSSQNVEEAYKKHFKKGDSADFISYEFYSEDELKGFCFDITGNGLWGSINALVAVSPDFKKIIGFDILKQNETPGLGGRITEAWFKDQFKNKPLQKKGELIQYELIAEDESTKEDQINQITGATFSSKAVVDVIYHKISEIGISMGKL